jgi:thiamine-phosphate pyrophosphorylase
LRLPPVYPIVDTVSTARAGLTAAEAAEALLEGGATIVQFRHKSFWSGEVFAAAERVADLCRAAGALFIVNDRADYAAMLGAGVHVGQEDLAPADVRRVIGPDAAIGFSTHRIDQLLAAAAEPVDYLAYGPIFITGSKERPDPTVGLGGLRQARVLTLKPLVAIGGISLEEAAACWMAGADSVAVISGLMPGECTKAALRDRMAAFLRAATACHV